MKNESLFLSIAGFIVQIVFNKTGWAQKKSFLKKCIADFFFGFIIRKQSPDTIIFITEKGGVDTISRKNHYYSVFYKKVSAGRYRTYYHLSIFELAHLLQIVIINQIRYKGFFIHASGVIINNKAYLFVGKSGVGKSTTINLLRSVYQPYADDCIIVKYEKDAYFCYQSPFIEKNSWVKKSCQKYPLGGIFILQKNHPFSIVQAPVNYAIKQLVQEGWSLDHKLVSHSKQVFLFLSRFKNIFVLQMNGRSKNRLILHLRKFQ